MAKRVQKNTIDRGFKGISPNDSLAKKEFLERIYEDHSKQFTAEFEGQFKELHWQDIEDAVHHAFRSVMNKIGFLQIQGSLIAYLRTACFNAVLDALKKNHNRDIANAAWGELQEKIAPDSLELMENEPNEAVIDFETLEEVGNGLRGQSLAIYQSYCKHSKTFQKEERFIIWYLMECHKFPAKKLTPYTNHTVSTLYTYKNEIGKELEELGPKIYHDIDFHGKKRSPIKIKQKNKE